MKLVMTFTFRGDWECAGYDQTIPIEYESAEALLLLLDDAMKAYVAGQKKQDEEIKKWGKKEPRGKAPEKYQSAKWKEWRNSAPRATENSHFIQLGGLTLYCCDMLDNSTKDPLAYTLPVIETLEEWFNNRARS